MQKKHIQYSIFILCAVIGMWIYLLFSPVVSEENGYVYYLRPGIVKRALITDLHERGIIKHPTALWLYAFPQKNSALKTGEYHFQKGSSEYSIWKQVTAGTGLMYHPFTLVPGWTFKQLRTGLLKAQGLRQATATLQDKQIMEKLGYPNLLPEGEFFPDTYNYTRGDTDFVILKRAFDRMQKKLQDVWKDRAEKLPYKTPYEMLIVASLIEREGFLDAERPIIAGVIMNRLATNMLLQVDATVIYGMGNRYNGKIRRENLLEDTPFNTYLHKGLPPTPIAMPGMSSLKAATHPDQNNFYYYVAKGNGAHEFSTTLDEHHAAVELQKQNGKST